MNSIVKFNYYKGKIWFKPLKNSELDCGIKGPGAVLIRVSQSNLKRFQNGIFYMKGIARSGYHHKN